MYIGSVRFFKHLILTTVALLILTPTCLAIFFGLKSRAISEKETAAKNALVQMQSKADEISVKYDELLAEMIAEEEEKNNKDGVMDSEHEVADGVMQENTTDAINYQESFPEMYVAPVKKTDNSDEKKVYLTFDDGPSPNTEAVLDILDENDIKATFFVIYKKDEFSNAMYKEIVNRGHTIAIHSTSHDYKKIYSSVQAFLDDFNIIFHHIYDTTGVEPRLFRFPGGSINGYNSGIYMEIIAEMTRRGFTYHDWNVSAQDASEKATVESIYTEVINGAEARTKSIVLMHDSAGMVHTIESLPKIISELKDKGYSFDRLNESVSPFIFSYIKPN